MSDITEQEDFTPEVVKNSRIDKPPVLSNDSSISKYKIQFAPDNMKRNEEICLAAVKNDDAIKSIKHENVDGKIIIDSIVRNNSGMPTRAPANSPVHVETD